MKIFDFRWDDKLQKPYFQYIEKGGIEKKFFEFGKEIFLTCSSADVSCVGSMQKGKYVPCPDKVVGKKKCERCKKAEDYFPCQFCNGFNCSKFRDIKIENCDADHMVYLALFNEEIVKVGVSRFTRGKARQFEQGSHYTRIFASGMSGVTARRIEHTIGKAGFKDKIPASQKKHILLPKISVKEGKKILDEKFEFAKENLLSHMPEMAKYIVENEFWDVREKYSNDFNALESSTLPIHFEQLEEGESIGGKLVGVKGSFLLIDTGTEIATVLAKNYVGKEISFEPCPLGVTKNGGFQGSMF